MPRTDEEAVWYESIDMSDAVGAFVEMNESVGVGACTPVARGRASRSSDPLGLTRASGRMVLAFERVDTVDCGLERMTVVLYSDGALRMLLDVTSEAASRSGFALLSLSLSARRS